MDDNSKPQKKRAYLIEEGGAITPVDTITVYGIDELHDIEGQWDLLDSKNDQS